ncbi:MAG: sigma-E factor negative regulatory protein [Agarilytica sp.]
MTENSRSSRTQSSADSVVSESLSALVDGEHNELDMQRVLKAMDSENCLSSGSEADEPGTVRETWSRYQLMSAVIHNEAHTTEVDCSIDLSAAIRDAIAEDAAPKVKRFHFQSFSHGIGKTAVAAAVTFGVVFGVQQYSTNPDNAAVPTFADRGGAVQQPSVVAGTSMTGAGVPQGFELPPLSAQTVSTNSLAPVSASSRSVAPFAESRSSGSAVSHARIVVPNDQFQEQMNRLMYKHAEQVSLSGSLGVIPFARVSNISDEEKD